MPEVITDTSPIQYLYQTNLLDLLPTLRAREAIAFLNRLGVCDRFFGIDETMRSLFWDSWAECDRFLDRLGECDRESASLGFRTQISIFSEPFLKILDKLWCLHYRLVQVLPEVGSLKDVPIEALAILYFLTPDFGKVLYRYP